MSVRTIHGAPEPPGRMGRACKGTPPYCRGLRFRFTSPVSGEAGGGSDRRGTGSVRARSSSSYANNLSNAWNVNFNNGNVNNNDKSNTNYARCVRGGTWKPLCLADRAVRR